MSTDHVAADVPRCRGHVRERDFIDDAAPDSLTPQIEQFQALMELKKFDAAGEIPFRAIVRAMPNLKDKQAFLKEMDAVAEKRSGEAEAARAL